MKTKLILLLLVIVLAACPVWAIRVYVNPSIQTSNYSPDGAYQEGSNMQDVAGRLTSKLQARGFEARNSAWMDLAAACADSNNWGSNCFVAIHTNAAGSGGWNSARGTQTFYHQNSGGWHNDSNVYLAQLINNKLVSKFGAFGRGYNAGVIADYPYMGWNMYAIAPWNTAAIPATLVEGLFHTNYSDTYDVLMTTAGRDAYAQGVFEGICDYYGWTYSSGPPWLFDSSVMGWTAEASLTSPWFAGSPWPGCLVTDQTGDDPRILSPTISSYQPQYPKVVQVDFYPQSGNTTSHDMKVYWKTNAENYYDELKSSPTVNYTAANDTWVRLNLNVNNAKWWNQTVNQMRLDFDNTNHGNRWIVNHIVLQNQVWYTFDNDTIGWSIGAGLSNLSYLGSPWPGCLLVDQTGSNACIFGPAIPANSEQPFHYIGGANDKIHVRLYPQNGSTSNHDMRVYWITESDPTWNDAKTTLVNYTLANNTWGDVYIPVGSSPNWAGSHITQLRLDFDEVNHGNRWIVDYMITEYN